MTEVMDLYTGTVQHVDAPPRKAVLIAYGYAQGDSHPEDHLHLYEEHIVKGVNSIACGDFCCLTLPQIRGHRQ